MPAACLQKKKKFLKRSFQEFPTVCVPDAYFSDVSVERGTSCTREEELSVEKDHPIYIYIYIYI